MNRKLLTALCVLALLVTSGWYMVLRPRPALRIAAEFAFADGIFPGNRVAILGVPVGTVETVQPRGASVRVTMSLPEDIKVPRDAEAYIMSPAVISDRFVELGPAYTSGPEMRSGTTIPVSRTHAPIKWDQLTKSLDTLLTALGPQGANKQGGLGELVHSGAALADGNGPRIRETIASVAQASELLADGRGDLGAVVDNVDKLVQLLAEHRSTIDSLATATTSAVADFNSQQGQFGDTLTQMSAALSAINDLIRKHGNQITGDVGNLTRLTNNLVQHQQQLSEIVGTLPLAADNLGRTITPDERMRLRMDLTTNLSQFDTTAKLCQRFPLPLCSGAGAGIVNQVPIPPAAGNPLGATGGGR